MEIPKVLSRKEDTRNEKGIQKTKFKKRKYEH